MAGGGGGGALQNEIQPVFDSTADVRRATQLLQAVEDEARDAAGSFCSLVASLREAMSEVTGSTRDHLACYNNAAGSLQNGCIDAATKGNKFVNSCLRLNEEMKDIHLLAAQVKMLRETVEQLEHQTARNLPRA